MTKPQLMPCHLAPASEDVIKVIQITDTHILDDDESLFNDFDTSASLLAVLETIKTDEADADLVLLTGDLVHEPTNSAYQKLADHLASVTTPLFYLPGNHDDPVKMAYVMGNNGFDHSNLVTIGNWSIVLLNTHATGEQGGELDQSELEFLQYCLEMHSEYNLLIAFHHHPVLINTPWMDGMALSNSAALFELLDPCQHVKGIVWGHIHQVYEDLRAHYQLLGSPSTCMQFTPQSDTFAVDDKPPAYRKLELHSDGRLLSTVNFIDYEASN